jgi:hypothetical protein
MGRASRLRRDQGTRRERPGRAIPGYSWKCPHVRKTNRHVQLLGINAWQHALEHLFHGGHVTLVEQK